MLLLLEKLDSWFRHPQVLLLLAVAGSLVLSTAQIDLGIDVRPDSWPTDILRHMTSIILRHYR